MFIKIIVLLVAMLLAISANASDCKFVSDDLRMIQCDTQKSSCIFEVKICVDK